MKNLFLLALILSIVSCQSTPDPATIKTVISGAITNPNGKTVTLRKGEFKEEISMDESGAFKAEFMGMEEGEYSFFHGNEAGALYITPGKNIHVALDAEQFDESITFTGAGAAVSNYLAQKFMNGEKANVYSKEVFSKDESDFNNYVTKVKSDNLRFAQEFKGLSKQFVAAEKEVIDMEYLVHIHRYGSEYRNYFSEDRSYEPSALFLKPLESVDLDKADDFENIPIYNQLVQIMLKKGSVKECLARLEKIKSENIRSNVISGIKSKISSLSETLDEDYSLLLAVAPDEAYKEDLKKRFDLAKSLAKGSPSPVFNFEDRNGKMVKLEDLKGRNVYIDVWATWCGPCIKEIPDLKKLETAYHDSNVEFVSISIDKMKDKEKWLKMIAEKELVGSQLFSDKDWKSDFVQDYGIKGIPRFILLDDQGKIVSADAPRPSSGEVIRGMIDDLKM